MATTLRLATLILLLIASTNRTLAQTTAVVPEVLLRGLHTPTDMVADPQEEAVLIAEAQGGRLLRWRSGSEPEILLEGLAVNERLVVALAPATSEPAPIIASSEVRLYRDGIAQGMRIRELNKAEVATSYLALAASSRYLFALRGGQLLRSRSSGNRFTTLRPHAVGRYPTAAAICFGEKGHLIVAHSGVGGQKSAQLTFHDPHAIAEPSVFVVQGIDQVFDIGLGAVPRPSQRRLYALAQGDGGVGLYRLDARSPEPDGSLTCEAQLMVEIGHPIAFAAASDGAIYVIANDEAGEGIVLRLTGNW